ncbi:MAG: FAD-dependent oxidoreductase [Phycisphaerales bacterium]
MSVGPGRPPRVVIVGGGLGGVASALALGESGIACLVLEPTAWIGGQATSQAVPFDENRWIESFGATRSYAAMRDGIRSWYRERESLHPSLTHAGPLNPGGGWVSRLCCAPRVAHGVLRSMLAPYETSGLVTVQAGVTLLGCDTAGDTVVSVRYRSADGEIHSVSAALFLEASETGDLLELASIEHRIGAEAVSEHGELHGLPEADRRCQQPPSWCFALEHRPGEDHRISRPEGYDSLRSWVPIMHDRPWPGPLFAWTIPTHGEARSRELHMVPWPDEPPGGEWELWRYRRIVEAAAHTDGRPDVCLVNWVQMDDWRQPTLTVPRSARPAVFARARQLSACLLYWMQTEAPRHDGGTGYPGLRLRGDELGTEDGFAMAPYIREPMRLEALHMLSEYDVGSDQRGHPGAGENGVPPEGRCVSFADSVAIGHYHIDLHPTPTGRNSVYVEACPFQIPLRSLVPVRVRNVLAAGKCLGVTHITNGATRTHAVEWAVGEAAGMAAALCVEAGIDAHAVCSAARAQELRRRLSLRGAPTCWPWDE